MSEATHLWEWWHALVGACTPVFTRPGWVRSVPWGTGLVLGWEEHTITPILTALGWESRWLATGTKLHQHSRRDHNTAVWRRQEFSLTDQHQVVERCTIGDDDH
jgi:hypothetical protein